MEHNKDYYIRPEDIETDKETDVESTNITQNNVDLYKLILKIGRNAKFML